MYLHGKKNKGKGGMKGGRVRGEERGSVGEGVEVVELQDEEREEEVILEALQED